MSPFFLHSFFVVKADAILQNAGADDIIIASSDMDGAVGEQEQGSVNISSNISPVLKVDSVIGML